MSARARLRGSLPYLAAIVGGFLLAYLVVAFFVFPSGVITGSANVPNVVGLPFDSAATKLAAVGLTASRGASEARDATPAGTVLDQDPRAGAKEPQGTTVSLTVAAPSS